MPIMPRLMQIVSTSCFLAGAFVKAFSTMNWCPISPNMKQQYQSDFVGTLCVFA